MVKPKPSYADLEVFTDTRLAAPACWLRQVQADTVTAKHTIRKLSSNPAVCNVNQLEWLSLAPVMLPSALSI